MFVLGVFTNKTKKSEIKQSDFTPNKTKKIRNEAKRQKKSEMKRSNFTPFSQLCVKDIIKRHN